MLRTDKEVKPHVNIVFIGHVDAGKSTMGGNILYLCGMVDKRTLEKYEREAKEAGRESWYLSWALDSTSQEREKVRFSQPILSRGGYLILHCPALGDPAYCEAAKLTKEWWCGVARSNRARRSKSDAPTSRPTRGGTPSSTPRATSRSSRR